MFYFENDDGICQGSEEKFFELTGAHWTDAVIIDPENAGSYRPKIDSSDFELMRYLRPLYAAYLKRPPKLLLKEGTAKGCHSVCALEPLAKGTVVTEYLGEWQPQPSAPSAYRFGPIEGRSYRNMGGMIEDGFPNLSPFYLYHVDGVPLRVIFVAMENIDAGDMLTFNYGMGHSVKVHYHSEYRFEALISFLQHNPLDKLIARIRFLRKKSPQQLGWKQTLELENAVVKLRYLFQTPSALLLAMAAGVLSGSEASAAYAQSEVRYFILNFPYQPNQRQREVISYLEEGLRYLSSANPVPDDLKTLLEALRQKIVFSLYLKDWNDHGAASKEEAWIWNEAFDAVQRGDRVLAEFKLLQTQQRERLVTALVAYGKEMDSSLVPWLLSLTEHEPPTSSSCCG